MTNLKFNARFVKSQTVISRSCLKTLWWI